MIDNKEILIGMAKNWKMYAVTREAFVVLTGGYVGPRGIWELSGEFLAKGAMVDIESCRAELDEEFANKVIARALILLEGK